MAASVETVKSFTREFLVEFEQKVPVPSQLKERIFELVLSRGQALVVKKPKVKRTAQTDADVPSTKADAKALIKAKSQSAIQKPAKKATKPENASVVAKPVTKVAEKPAQPAKERKALAPIATKTSTALKPKNAAPKATAAAVVAKTATTKAVVDKENDANAASSSLLNIAKGVATKVTGLKLQAQKPATVTKTVKPAAPVAIAAKPVPAIPKDECPEDGESDEARLRARQKQIEYGKNTDGYRNYVAKVPKDQRVKGMPSTPEKYQKCSKRSWDGQVRKWRRQLHAYDPAPAPLSDDLDLIDGEDLSTRFNELQLGQGSLKATDAFSLEDKPRAVKVLQF